MSVVQRREETGAVIGETTLIQGENGQYNSLKVPRLCPLVLLVKVGFVTAYTLIIGEGKLMLSGLLGE
jgi:hypothetical protein